MSGQTTSDKKKKSFRIQVDDKTSLASEPIDDENTEDADFSVINDLNLDDETPPKESEKKEKKKEDSKDYKEVNKSSKKYNSPKKNLRSVKDESDKKEEKVAPETVNVKDLAEEQKNEEVTIDFMNEDGAESFIGKKTKSSDLSLKDDDDEKSIIEGTALEGKTVEEIREQIRNEEDNSSSFTPEDYAEIAEFLVDIIDWLMSSLLRWYGKDSSDRAYSLSTKKKKRLAYQLSMILMKHQTKWSIELMFIITLIGVYSVPFMEARKNRKNGAPERGPGNQKKP